MQTKETATLKESMEKAIKACQTVVTDHKNALENAEKTVEACKSIIAEHKARILAYQYVLAQILETENIVETEALKVEKPIEPKEETKVNDGEDR